MTPHLRELAPLLVALGRAGIELAPHPTDAARLRYRPATLPPELAAELRGHQAAVLRLLAAPRGDGSARPTPEPSARGDAADAFLERLGVADDLGMPTHPGAPAWLIAVGESLAASCQAATDVVHSGHGTNNQSDRGRGEGERSDSLRDRQGRGRGP